VTGTKIRDLSRMYRESRRGDLPRMDRERAVTRLPRIAI
jgi:hypothetical protein